METNTPSDKAEEYSEASTALLHCVLQGKDSSYVIAVLSHFFSGPGIKAQSTLFHNKAVTVKVWPVTKTSLSLPPHADKPT